MNQVEKLREKGAHVLLPNTVYIDPEVDLERVNPEGLIIYPGVRILGERTLIGKDVEIGLEEAVTLNNSCLGEKVKVKGGYLEDAVLLDRVEVGKGAHIRAGTLMEEQSGIAHCVGLKQTILMPFVVLGSLINFCDCLLAGGTSRKDHSEVGSSFIHFNFTPYGKCGDKATPSLFGDVPHGVMLNNPRIFLGGEAGVVGPVEIGYGTVLAAGAVYRRDHKEKKQIGETNFNPLVYSNITSKVIKNIRYIGNLIALREWYRHIRMSFAGSNPFRKSLFLEAENNISSGIEERIKRLDALSSSLEDSIGELRTQKGERYRRQTETQSSFCSSWPQMKSNLSKYQQITGDEKLRDDFLAATAEIFVDEEDYIPAIQSLADEVSQTGTAWLNSIVEQTCRIGESER
jgi:UDP-N-acetylglucosamine/UDP-N-acetylgalactosamine diphosphorylase